MLKRRLYLQIYMTLIVSLVMVVLLSGLLWELFGRDRVDGGLLDGASRLVAMVLPASEAPIADQQQAIQMLGRELDVELSLYSAGGQLIASYGDAEELPARFNGESGFHRRHGGPVVSIALPDGRWLVADRRDDDGFKPLLSLLLLLGVVAVCVALVSYPLVRRLTKRLERLQTGVERMGAGDLSARVEVKGRDEVARLASGFNEAAEKIEKLVGAHRMLLANASHELRTPLSRIRLGLEMSDGSLSDKRRAALKRDIAELDTLIDEILLMSKLDAATRVDRSQMVDLVALVAEECARFDDCSLSGTAPEIPGDARLLHRLMRNLLDNACKHGLPPVSVEIAVVKGAVSLTVSDGGKGIDAHDRERVFQPFQRGADRQNIVGYGLGLPLVRQIARAHGGDVALVDRSPTQSAICVTLPLVLET